MAFRDLSTDERRLYERSFPVSTERPTPKPTTFGDLVPGLVDSMQLAKRDWCDELGDQWNDLVNPSLAKHSRPQRFQGGTLHIGVDHPIFLAEFKRTEGRRLLQTIQQAYPAAGVQAISWHIAANLHGG